jgi:hypothetical protein
MSRKTRKQSKRQRRRTLRRKTSKGGSSNTQSLIPPTSAFKNITPVNSNNLWYKIG